MSIMNSSNEFVRVNKITSKLVSFTNLSIDADAALSRTEFCKKHFYTDAVADAAVIAQLPKLRSQTEVYDEESAARIAIEESRAEMDAAEQPIEETTVTISESITTDTNDQNGACVLINRLANVFFDVADVHIDNVVFEPTRRIYADFDAQNNVVMHIGVKTELFGIDFNVKLIHEMIHVYNSRFKEPDTCGHGAYHNEIFYNVALDCHLTAKKTRGQGWGNTEPTEQLVHRLQKAGINPDERMVFLPSISTSTSKSVTRKSQSVDTAVLMAKFEELQAQVAELTLALMSKTVTDK